MILVFLFNFCGEKKILRRAIHFLRFAKQIQKFRFLTKIEYFQVYMYLKTQGT